MSMEHMFKPGGSDGDGGYSDIVPGGGTYWWLHPYDKTEKRGSPRDFFFPVQENISFEWSHNWVDGDNFAKSILNSFGSLGAFAGIATRKLFGSGGLYLSSPAFFVDTNHPTVTINTKIFSPDGDGSLLSTIENLRNCSHGLYNEKPSVEDLTSMGTPQNIAEGAVEGIKYAQDGLKSLTGIKFGWINHPTFWSIKIVTMGGMDGDKNPKSNSPIVIAEWADMSIRRLNIVLYTPFIGVDPSVAEISMDLTQAYPGLNVSSRIGVGKGDVKSSIPKSSGGGYKPTTALGEALN